MKLRMMASKWSVGFFITMAACCVVAAELPSAAVVALQAKQVLAESGSADGPGIAVLVARGDEVLYRGGRGMAQIELGVPMTADQVFRIASNTKQFTAATILKLVEQGRLSLTDPLSKYLPNYPNGAHITIDQLLNHTSGIKDYTEIDGYFSGAIRQDLDTEKLLAVFKDLPVDFAPGTNWKYDNSGYLVLGAVIEKLTGKSWQEAIREQLLAPLALTHTVYDEAQPLIANRSAGYTVDEKGRTENAAYLSMSQAGAAGGLASNVDDLFHWLRALHTGKVLTADSYRRMTTPVPMPSGQSADSAYGLSVLKLRGEKAFEGDGRIPGFMSVTLYVPEPAVTVVVLTNTDLPHADLGTVASKLAAIALGRPYAVRHPIALTAAQMRALIGVYKRGDSGRRIVTARGNELYTQRDGGRAHVLHAASTDVLYFDEVLDYFKVVRSVAGKVVALDEFADGDAPAMRLSKLKEPLPPQAHKND